MIKQRKTLIFVSGLVILVLSIVASTPQKEAQTFIPARFDFSPEENSQRASAPLTLALIAPNYGENFVYSKVSPFREFSSALVDDMEEMMVARGYNLRGPFDTKGDMVYSDKEQSDLILGVNINLNLTDNARAIPKTKTSIWGISSTDYRVSGSLGFGGKLNLEIREPFSSEMLWKKSILLEDRNILVDGDVWFTYKPSLAIALSEDAGVRNPFTKVLIEFYSYCVDLVWKHLDPRELAPLKDQGAQIKENYRHIGR